MTSRRNTNLIFSQTSSTAITLLLIWKNQANRTPERVGDGDFCWKRQLIRCPLGMTRLSGRVHHKGALRPTMTGAYEAKIKRRHYEANQPKKQIIRLDNESARGKTNLKMAQSGAKQVDATFAATNVRVGFLIPWRRKVAYQWISVDLARWLAKSLVWVCMTASPDSLRSLSAAQRKKVAWGSSRALARASAVLS